MRKRNDWKKWLLPPEQQESTLNISSPVSPSQIIVGSLTPHFQKLGLEGSNSNPNLPLQGEASFSRPSTSGDLQLTGLHVSSGPGQVMAPVDVGRMLVMSDTF